MRGIFAIDPLCVVSFKGLKIKNILSLVLQNVSGNMIQNQLLKEYKSTFEMGQRAKISFPPLYLFREASRPWEVGGLSRRGGREAHFWPSFPPKS